MTSLLLFSLSCGMFSTSVRWWSIFWHSCWVCFWWAVTRWKLCGPWSIQWHFRLTHVLACLWAFWKGFLACLSWSLYHFAKWGVMPILSNRASMVVSISLLFSLLCSEIGFLLLIGHFPLVIGFGRDWLYHFLLFLLSRVVVRPFLVYHVAGTCFGLDSLGMCVLPIHPNSGSHITLLFYLRFMMLKFLRKVCLRPIWILLFNLGLRPMLLFW